MLRYLQVFIKVTVVRTCEEPLLIVQDPPLQRGFDSVKVNGDEELQSRTLFQNCGF
jgi:hypothetical protein